MNHSIMKRNIFYWALVIATMASFTATAKEERNKPLKKAGGTKSALAACGPATASIDLDINNVRALLMNGGDMWWDRGVGQARYEVPKVEPGSGGKSVSSLFAAAIWVGGIDASGALRVAGQTYRQGGNDYYPGPLDQNAATESAVCSSYDRFWKINYTDIKTFLSTSSHSVSATPKAILEWPAKGNPYAIGTANAGLTIDFELAPYNDVDGNGAYDPTTGDYPILIPGCRDAAPDQAIWWVYNDKGNVHTETSGDPIGLQINATAFGFKTNDDVNNMTFYTYELYNKGNYILDSAFIAQWADPDLGFAGDDYIGCDTSGTYLGNGTGLGICYNADNNDQDQPLGYGSNIPMVGIDFFQGPKDINNKELGMTGFYYYYNTTPSGQADPQNAVQFYGYMTGTWRDGQRFSFGGNAHTGGSNTHYCFPDWPNKSGTNPATSLPYWSMCAGSVTPEDLRIVESSGPFHLIPGSKQVITVGVVWVPKVPYPCPSFELLLNADRKAQALFDGCFKLLDGPDAPTVNVKEYDKEIILTLANEVGSNNFNENYLELDNTILPYVGTVPYTHTDSLEASYRFEGYQIYQLLNAKVSTNDLDDLSLAREVAQVDISNKVSRIINWISDPNLGVSGPVKKVEGTDLGIKHSFQFTKDAFATDEPKLINHKTYYYMVIAYGYNNYRPFSDADPTSQDNPYLAGRRNVQIYSAIPHLTDPERGGTILHSKYGDQPLITRIEGYGNANNFLDLTAESEAKILKDGFLNEVEYDSLGGPIDVKIVDPKHVKPGKFEVYIVDTTNNTFIGDFSKADSIVSKNAYYIVKEVNSGAIEYSVGDLSKANELMFEKWGFSISIAQVAWPGTRFSDVKSGGGTIINLAENNGFLSWEGESLDPTKGFIPWVGGAQDGEGEFSNNWIRSGTNKPTTKTAYADYDLVSVATSNAIDGIDKDQDYEKVVVGTWAPYRLCQHTIDANDDLSGAIIPALLPSSTAANKHVLNELFNVDIVFTSDKSKWTKCPVVESDPDIKRVQPVGSVSRLSLRDHASWGDNTKVTTEGNPDYDAYDAQTKGMSWFPGYAINLESGERVNMMFGEDSWFKTENGDDMLWNPTATFFSPTGEAIYGGRHFIYIMKTRYSETAAKQYRDDLATGNNSILKDAVYKDAIWVGAPMLINPIITNVRLRNAAEGIIPKDGDVRLKIRMRKPYAKFNTGGNAKFPNYPLYTFDMTKFAADTSQRDFAVNALDLVNIVPNPYYAYSVYETGRLDNNVKITNLPKRCEISIYTIDGTLIRQFKRDTETPNFQDWDLKNSKGVPIASGMYLIHINAEGLGKNANENAQRIIKWFGVMRQTDLNSY
jgi:hypothetical protein